MSDAATSAPLAPDAHFAAAALARQNTARGWATVSILLVFYVFSFIDRQIMTLMVAPIERDLGIGDFEMSLLIGPAFGLFYVACGLFIGGLIDRFPRPLVIACGVLIWGLATAGSGLVSSFRGIFFARMGVGVGEAALAPAAHALIAESFPPQRLSTAMAVFTMGVIIGSATATLVGGTLIHLVSSGELVAVPVFGAVRPWQAVFLCVGVATLLLLPLLLLLPRSTWARPVVTHASGADGEAFAAFVRRNWRIFLLLPIGFGCTNVIVQANASWLPSLLGRVHGWDPARIGLWLGVLNLVFGLAGQLGGAMVVDRFYARGKVDAHVRYHLIGLAISVPCLIVGLASGQVMILLAMAVPFQLLSLPFVAYAVAALQIRTPSHLRGRVSALFLVIVTALGTLLGAPVTGYLTQHVLHDPTAIATSLIAVDTAAGLIGFLTLSVVSRALRRQPV